MRLLTVTLFLAISLIARADDWKLPDGTVYTGVKVLSHDDGFVTIMDSDGGAKIPLRLLPLNLQESFNYDPDKAVAAEKAAAAQDQKDAAAIAAEHATAVQQGADQIQAQKAVSGSVANQEATSQLITNNEMTIQEDQEKIQDLDDKLARFDNHNNATEQQAVKADYQNQERALKAEVATLQKQDLALSQPAPAPTPAGAMHVLQPAQPAPQRPTYVYTPPSATPSPATTAAFHCFIRDLVAESKLVNGIYQGGELAGLTRTQVFQRAGVRWATMTPEEKSIYMDEAKSGDPAATTATTATTASQ